MAPHTRQRDPQVRERAGLMGKPDKSGGSWMDGMGEGGIATWQWQVEQAYYQNRHLTWRDSHSGELKHRPTAVPPSPTFPLPIQTASVFQNQSRELTITKYRGAFTVPSGLCIFAYFILIVTAWRWPDFCYCYSGSMNERKTKSGRSSLLVTASAGLNWVHLTLQSTSLSLSPAAARITSCLWHTSLGAFS